jgi:hypothetical protein
VQCQRLVGASMYSITRPQSNQVGAVAAGRFSLRPVPGTFLLLLRLLEDQQILCEWHGSSFEPMAPAARWRSSASRGM